MGWFHNGGTTMQRHYVHTPAHRRVHATTPLDIAVLRVLRSAMKTDWSPADAVAGAQAALTAVGGSTYLLRKARAQLLRTFPPSKSEIGARALLALTYALCEVDDTGDAPDLPLAQ